MISDTPTVSAGGGWHLFIPKLVTALRDGYRLRDAGADLFAGLTVSVVALPLSLALAIASGVTPERGLFTAAVAGVIVSLLGGSRFQIAGPTGAFVVVVAGIVHQFGYQGLVIAMLLAGAMLIVTGALKLGTYIKYIPFPVVTGFTAGIAVVIFSSQLGDILGLTVLHPPADAFGRLAADAAAIGTFNPFACAIALAALSSILVVQKFVPRLPSFLIAIVLAGACVRFLHLSVATIGTRFGGIPSALPAPHMPSFTFTDLRILFPAAFTIFALGGIESLLSAVVADAMTGRRHRANCELVAQGLANIACAIMGGIPATGAIARTATNIRAGARTPIAGIVHSLAIIAMMALFAPLASYIPLAALGAVLAVVCWNMAELRVFATILQSTPGDRAVLVVTFLLTIFVDLSVAIAAGVVLASLIFARNMADTVSGGRAMPRVADDIDEWTTPNTGAVPRGELPAGVEAVQLSGPFFFAAAAEFEELLSRSGGAPKVLILRMASVPLIDASGAAALQRFIRSAGAKGTAIIISELPPEPMSVLRGMDIAVPMAASFGDSISLARRLRLAPQAFEAVA
ncbi:MAG TPA: SulP family inorganic anion transporter [Rhizomicrobium sp.]|nr:SulP family inorganic anion transporter [Rhizomicrobium sp.]